MDTEHKLLRYLQDVTGREGSILEGQPARAAALPLYLRTYYDVREVNLFGRKLMIAVQKDDTDPATPTEYSKHHDALSSFLGDHVALVLPDVTAATRQRLVQFGVPFVVPGRQMFLPSILVDLRERFARAPRRSTATLTAAAHVVLLRHLLGDQVQGLSLRELALTLSYSAMTLSNVRDELEAAGLCASKQEGRSTFLVFEKPRSVLWEQALPHLRNPVKARHWIRWGNTVPDLTLQAGFTALSAMSMVADDDLLTFAMAEPAYRRHLEAGRLHGCDGPEGAQARLECWRYDPTVLSKGPVVDVLSLYLSLQQVDDERVAKALQDLLGSLPW